MVKVTLVITKPQDFNHFLSLTRSAGSNKVLAWKCKGLEEERIKPPDTLDCPKLTLIHNAKIVGKFEGSCLEQDKVSFNHMWSTCFLVLN